MRNRLAIPDLTFPGFPLSPNETPLDLKRFLYLRGASTRINRVDASILRGDLGAPLSERVELVKLAHDFIAGRLIAGGSPETTRTQIRGLSKFFSWIENSGLNASLMTIQGRYIHWTDALRHDQIVAKTIKPNSAYVIACSVGRILDYVLDREKPIIEATRLRAPNVCKTPQGRIAEKQNLQSTFAFGRLMQEICDNLTFDAISGVRPFQIVSGGNVESVAMAPLRAQSTVEMECNGKRKSSVLASADALPESQPGPMTATRRRVLGNLRIMAELFMFVGQTGMNLAQAHELKLRHFSYASDRDGYRVRDYKGRRGGEVIFEIFKEYRSHLERYLEWRRRLFPHETRLFPLQRSQGALESSRPFYGPIKRVCKDAGVEWITPRLLRSTRVNWLLRRSGDADLTAEMAQHSKQTLLDKYHIPSLQIAIGEVSRFWVAADPSLSRENPLQPVAPGACDGAPLAVPFKPKSATEPDCIYASGCLWCEHHRDVDSPDYVWALASFRYLKSLELCFDRSRYKLQLSEHPAHHALTRISNKLTWFRSSSLVRTEWVDEANIRIEEGHYHPDWQRLIQATQGVLQ